ncbi:MAG: glycosyltransferase family 4 protein [Clostridiales bacterium]|nr:glycosyltransferase family 4 protein [Clostridiales bacterium]MCF8022841.1 glycosyltransferase family 4 protein [Clostridiales bacterium]
MAGKHILVVDHSVPTYDQDSGSLRIYSILKILVDLNYSVTFIPCNQAQREPYTSDLQKIGIEVVFGDVEDFLKTWGRLFKIVILSRPDEAFNFLPYIRAYAINSRIIYDTVDIHWLRNQRAADLYGDQQLKQQARYYRNIETVNALCSDLIFTVTEDDKKVFSENNPELPIELIPNIHEPVPVDKPFCQRKDLMFIGGFCHQPNVDAMLFFSEEIFPVIREKIPGIKLYIVGSNPPVSIQQLNDSNIEVTGFVKDVQPFFENCRVFVAPLRYGAGMKGKIGQSMAYGLPVVTTWVGAEGMNLTNVKNVLIADEPQMYAQEVVNLYQNEVLWNKISANSIKHIEENYSPEVIKEKIDRVLSTLLKTKLRIPNYSCLNPPVQNKELTKKIGSNSKTFSSITRGNVLVVGVYLAEQENNMEHLVREFRNCREWNVVQKWASIGRENQSSMVDEYTKIKLEQGCPKYTMLNMLLRDENLDDYDFIITCDDDITLPPSFIDTFLGLEQKYDFALAQPARTHNSYIDHAIVEKLDGLKARVSRFIESGPLVCYRYDAWALLLPFDEDVSPMGWGYDFIWPYLIEQAGMRSGIIDAAAVEHSMRKPVANYDYEEAKKQMEDCLSQNPYYSIEDAYTIIESYA